MTNYHTREDSRRILLAARAYWLSMTDIGTLLERAARDVYQCETKRHGRMHGEYYGGVSYDTWRLIGDNTPVAAQKAA
jgi:hypothetical protein